MKMTTIKESCSLHARIGWQGLTKKEYLDEGDYYLVTGVDFDRGRIAFEKCHYVTKDRYDQDPHIQLGVDDVLVTKDGTIGKVAIIDVPVDKPATLNSGVFVVRPKNTEKLLPRYLMLVLQSNRFNRFIERIKVGCTIAHLNQEKFFGFSFPLPSVEKQKYMISIFEALSSLLDKRQQEILALDNLIKARFVEMFGDEDQVLPMKDICAIITDGTHQPPKFVSEGIPFIFVSNITGNTLTYDAEKYIDQATYDDLIRRTPIEIGDILLSTVGSYGHPAVVKSKKKFLFQRHIAYLKPRKELIDSDYLHGAILSPDAQMQIEAGVKGIAQKTLNLSEIKKLAIPIPTMAKQKQFAAFVTQIDKSKSIVLKQQVYITASPVRGIVSVGG